MKGSTLLLAVILSFLAGTADAQFVAGGQYYMLSRNVERGAFTANSRSGDAFAVFAGFDVKNSTFYLEYYREDTELNEVAWTYQKRQVSLNWHWNEPAAEDKSYYNTSLGIFQTSYDRSEAFNANFVGFSAGAGYTRYLVRQWFFNIRGKIYPMMGDDDELFVTHDPDDDQTVFFGYEAQAAIGREFRRNSLWTIQLGFKRQEIDFKERFYSDSNHCVFLTASVLVPYD